MDSGDHKKGPQPGTNFYKLLMNHASTLENLQITDVLLIHFLYRKMTKIKTLEIIDCYGMLDDILKKCPNVEILRIKRSNGFKCYQLDLLSTKVCLPLRELHMSGLIDDTVKKKLQANLKKY